jgi:hypothetical protein
VIWVCLWFCSGSFTKTNDKKLMKQDIFCKFSDIPKITLPTP